MDERFVFKRLMINSRLIFLMIVIWYTKEYIIKYVGLHMYFLTIIDASKAFDKNVLAAGPVPCDGVGVFWDL